MQQPHIQNLSFAVLIGHGDGVTQAEQPEAAMCIFER